MSLLSIFLKRSGLLYTGQDNEVKRLSRILSSSGKTFHPLFCVFGKRKSLQPPPNVFSAYSDQSTNPDQNKKGCLTFNKHLTTQSASFQLINDILAFLDQSWSSLWYKYCFKGCILLRRCELSATRMPTYTFAWRIECTFQVNNSPVFPSVQLHPIVFPSTTTLHLWIVLAPS